MAFSAKWPQLLLWAVLIVLLFFTGIPVLWAILGSFKSNADILNHPFSFPAAISLENYVSAWTLGHFGTYFYNTLFITVFGLLLVLIVSCPAGYVFGQIRFRGSTPLFYCFLAGLTLPSQTIIIPLFYQLKQLGLVNSLWGVILASVGLGLPFSVFLMRNTFKGLPRELRESAFVDGAGEWRTFLTVMLPLAKPGVMALVIFTFMGLWNEYLLPLTVLITPQKFTIAIGMAAFQSELTTNYSVIFAGAIIAMIPSLIVYILFQRQFIEGVSAGSQKG